MVYGNGCHCCRAGGVYTSGWWLLYIYIYITHQLGASELHQPHKLQHRTTSENEDLPLKPKADTPPPPLLTRVLYMLTTYGSRMFIRYQQRLAVDLGKIRIPPNLYLHDMRPP